MRTSRTLITALFIAILSAGTALAYPVTYTVDANTAFTTSVYPCTDSSCSTINTPAAASISNSNRQNNYTIAYAHSGNQYYAEYDYAACMVPHAYFRTTNSNTQSASNTIAFEKEADCTANIIVSLPDTATAAVNDIIRVQATVDSPLVFHPQGPQQAPFELADIYSQNITLYLYDNGVLYSARTEMVMTSTTQQTYFNYTATSVGLHELEIRTTSEDECVCSSYQIASDSIAIDVVADHIVLQPIGNFTIYEGEQVSFPVNATDVYNHALTYSYTSLPLGSIFDSVFGAGYYLFEWAPDFTQAGVYNITFTAHDGAYGNFARESVFITVLENQTVSQPNASIEDLSVIEVTLPQGIFEMSLAEFNATISNTGLAKSTSVEFYLNGNPIGIAGLGMMANTTAIVSMPWTATNGTYDLTVMVDPLNLINESDESNNNRTIQFVVPYNVTANNTNITNITIMNCTDSDGGLSYGIPGTTTTLSESFNDFCIDNTRIYEGYCDIAGTAQKTIYSCQYGCSNGACLSSSPSQGLSFAKEEPEDETSLLLVKSLDMYGVDNQGYDLFVGMQGEKLIADLTIENAGTIDKQDVIVSFSIPELGIVQREKIKSLNTGDLVSLKLEVQLPQLSGEFEAKVSVTAEGFRTSKYRVIEVI